MGEANGTLSSAFLDHVQKYPVVSDSINAYKSNPYGQKSIDLTNAGFDKFVKPFTPYLEKPAAYAKPYAAKADELGDTFLTKIDEKYPIVTSETGEIKSTIFQYANWPLEKAGETKDYLFKTYNNEYERCGGDGIISGSKALVTSSLVITSDYLSYLSSFLQKKKAEAKDVAKEQADAVQEKTSSN